VSAETPVMNEGSLKLRLFLWFGLALCSMVLLTVPTQAAQEEPSSSSTREVRYIKFKGVENISSSELKKLLTTKEKFLGLFTKAPLDEKILTDDLERIQTYYRGQGFYHARVVSHDTTQLFGNEVLLEIQVEEGPPMVVSAVTLQVNGDPEGPWHSELLRVMPLRVGSRFTTPDYRDIEKAVVRYLSDWGYPKARVDLNARLDKSTNQATVAVDVRTGPICYFGSIILEGNENVADQVIYREITFYPGDRFNGSKIQDTQQRLFGLELFQFVDLTVENMDGEGTTLPVRILLKEAKKQTVRVGVGYGTEDELRGQLQWEIRNFFGDGRRLQINAKASSIVQLLQTRFLQPYFLTPRSTLTVDSGIEHENQVSFENQKEYLDPVFNYKWNERLSSYIGYDLAANRLSNVKVQPVVQGPENQERENYFVSSLLQGNAWERVDIPANPRQGLRFFQTVEWATSALGSQVDYVKLVLEGRGYLPLSKYGVLAAKLKWGGIHPLENTDYIPIFKRAFSGGADSVRGYPYQKLGPLDQDGNPIGGMTLVEGSLEWRFPLPKSFEGVLFTDFGNVFERSFEVLWSNLRYTAGCGIRYLTLVGPLRLDFGYQLNPPDQHVFNPYQFYFSIGQAF
jgi:outer membrane protein insertion porin family/translocation and assembly module TamA